MKCNNNFLETQTKIIEIEAGQYFAPLLYNENIKYRRIIKEFYSFPKFSNYLFNPQAYITDKVKSFKKKENFDNHFMIGVHIRKNKDENLFYNVPVKSYWKCLNNKIRYLKDKNIKYKIFLSTDNKEVKEEAKSLYRDKLIVYSNNEVYDREKESVIVGMIEMYILSGCNEMVLTEKSTFSHLSHCLVDFKPLYVLFRDRYFPVCKREYSTEPKFHLYFRSDSIHCN
jgi:hypothetical protein